MLEYIQMKIPAFLKSLIKEKPTMLSEEQKRTVEIGREQFKRLLEKKLAIPVVLL